VRLEFDRKEGTTYVYAMALPVQPDDLLAIDADVPYHDVEITVFAKPIVGEIKSTKTRVGGYGNRDNVHGTLVYVKQLFRDLQGAAWLTVHSPVPPTWWCTAVSLSTAGVKIRIWTQRR
jgi:hypothetical protein